MKKAQIIGWTAFLAIFAQTASALGLEDFSLSPENPSERDSVEVSLYVAPMYSHSIQSVTRNGQDITVTALASDTLYPDGAAYYDTETIGQLPVGEYNVLYRVQYSIGSEDLGTESLVVREAVPEISVEGGYLKLDTLAGAAPDPNHCLSDSDRGRMLFDDANGVLYICAQSGWVTK